MSTLPALISDLALILIVAGAVTLIFKRLKQPLVLGYIVAGFLAGPHMDYTPSVADMPSIEVWSEIGVIFLMFSLGLEFSFKKIAKKGFLPIVTAFLVMFFMFCIGAVVGKLFGWAPLNCIFLGAMLSMSSTTIIYKAYKDLGLQQRKFASTVMSVLIIEDILGILLMVILTALGISQKFEGWALVESLATLAFFLILWFVVGIFLIPIIFKHTRKLMNRETLLIVSVGLCFLLVVFADRAGYSTAIGAFMMGSILAETIEAESIVRVVSPLKDLFGAIFFVSVGMLVDPDILVEHWLPIVALVGAILVGQATFGTLSFLVTGQPSRTAMQCGFSLAQIGEFAFIIASLGLELKVIDDFLYPVVVAVSVITTFITPYMIRASQKLPAPNIRLRLPSVTAAPNWRAYLQTMTVQVASYVTLIIAVTSLSLAVFPTFNRMIFRDLAANIVTAVLTIAAVSPFLRALVMRKRHTKMVRELAAKRKINALILNAFFQFRFFCAWVTVTYIVDFMLPLRWWWDIPLGFVITWYICRSRLIKYVSILMERTFVLNLRRRETVDTTSSVEAFAEKISGEGHQKAPVKLKRLVIDAKSPFVGKNLVESGIRQAHNCTVVGFETTEGTLEIPDAERVIIADDVIWVVGSPTDIINLTHNP